MKRFSSSILQTKKAGILPGSADWCIHGKVYLRSDLPSKPEKQTKDRPIVPCTIAGQKLAILCIRKALQSVTRLLQTVIIIQVLHSFVWEPKEWV